MKQILGLELINHWKTPIIRHHQYYLCLFMSSLNASNGALIRGPSRGSSVHRTGSEAPAEC
jgi:hypothetical protein